MIQQILDSLFDHQDFTDEDYAINIVVRDPLLIKIFFKNDSVYFIKAATKQANDSVRLFREFMSRENVKYDALPSGFQKVIREHDAFEKCNKIYPGLTPVPIIFKESDHYVALMTRNLEHTNVNIFELFQARGQLQKFLVGHERMVQIKCVDLGCHVSTFNQALNLLPEYLQQDLQKIRFMRAWDNMLKALPIIPQHGDLAINNVALTPSGLILFDWEDYSFIKLPGFDLCILLASGSNFDLSKLLLLIENDIHKLNQESFLFPIIQGLGISTSQLLDLILVNLVIFYQLKVQLGYGREVIISTENLLKQLSLFVSNKFHSS